MKLLTAYKEGMALDKEFHKADCAGKPCHHISPLPKGKGFYSSMLYGLVFWAGWNWSPPGDEGHWGYWYRIRG